MIKIADKSRDGWQVIAESESDELASGSEDEKRLKKAWETASRRCWQEDQANNKRGKKVRISGSGDNQLFHAPKPSMTSFYFVNSHNLDLLAHPTVFLVCLIIMGIEG